jgi:hypothetical protein
MIGGRPSILVVQVAIGLVLVVDEWHACLEQELQTVKCVSAQQFQGRWPMSEPRSDATLHSRPCIAPRKPQVFANNKCTCS